MTISLGALAVQKQPRPKLGIFWVFWQILGISDDVIQIGRSISKILDRDKEAPEDEPEVAIPQKQKFSNYEKLSNSSNYSQVPDQEEETFM